MLTVVLVLLLLATILGGIYLAVRNSDGSISWPAAPYTIPSPSPYDPDATPTMYPTPSFDVESTPVNSPDAYVPFGEPTPYPYSSPDPSN